MDGQEVRSGEMDNTCSGKNNGGDGGHSQWIKSGFGPVEWAKDPWSG